MNDRPEEAVDAAGSVTSDPQSDPAARLRWELPWREVPLGRQLDAGAAPATTNAAWLWLLYAGLGFLAGEVLAAVIAGIAAELAGQFHSLTALSKLATPPTWYIVSTLCGLWGGFLGAAVLASRLHGTTRFFADLGVRFRWIDLLGIPIGVGSQFLISVLYLPIAPHVHDFHQRFAAPAQRLTGGSHGTSYAVIVVATVVGAPFFEELFFRGVLLRSLARLLGPLGVRFGPALAILVSGIVFGLFHFEALQLLGLAFFGVVLGTVSYLTGRLGMNMVAHASFNLLALVAVVSPGLLGVRVAI